ncbi:MAG TPA: cytochrome c oxidase subunit 3 [Terriglobales bacterium]|jgi:cytochrome c oxidase subunit 3|nr:cytochrome c oxidase subunit 3 [Terriglobales bacterium]
MATTVHEPPRIDPDRLPEKGHTGNGGWGNFVPTDGDLRVTLEYSPPPSSTAIWVVLFAVTMMFAAFSSALIVRKGSSQDWQSFTLPPILYLNTLILLLSSVTLEVARRRVSAFMRGMTSRTENPASWLYITLALGLLFVAGQYVAWTQLRAQGLYLATNPSSSFFYVLTVTHVVHVMGGLGGLLYVIRKLSKSSLRRNAMVATARYWHFMGGLWVYLILLLWFKM